MKPLTGGDRGSNNCCNGWIWGQVERRTHMHAHTRGRGEGTHTHTLSLTGRAPVLTLACCRRLQVCAVATYPQPAHPHQVTPLAIPPGPTVNRQRAGRQPQGRPSHRTRSHTRVDGRSPPSHPQTARTAACLTGATAAQVTTVCGRAGGRAECPAKVWQRRWKRPRAGGFADGWTHMSVRW